MRESRTSGSTSGVRRRSMDELVRHRQPKGSATDMLILNHRAASRLYRVRAIAGQTLFSNFLDPAAGDELFQRFVLAKIFGTIDEILGYRSGKSKVLQHHLNSLIRDSGNRLE